MKNIQLAHQHHQSSNQKHPLSLLLHDMNIPANVGSIFRIADAMGVEKIYLTGTTVSPPNKLIKKTSRATEKYVAYQYREDPIENIEYLKALGYLIISLEITSSSIDIRELKFSSEQKVCLILGAENTGVCQTLLDLSDYTVHIPMLGNNSSMNVASACSIAVFQMINEYK
ncbi:TrmH family RNA methyltransferase [Aliikangiella sp. IMCC44359]|uniref:TrmH family RNA methyltransferase n=1 Tax=Aliikangiella sp. IMCC44359 TaxID=3459125 RepID=UPI00403A90F0